MTQLITHPGWPSPSVEVLQHSSGVIALRITERRVEYGCIDLTPEAARQLARALDSAAYLSTEASAKVDEIERHAKAEDVAS